MLPLPALNALRREAVKKQSELFAAVTAHKFTDCDFTQKAHAAGKCRYIIRGESFAQLESVKTAEGYILSVDRILESPEKAEDVGEFLYGELPASPLTAKTSKKKLEKLKSLGITTLSTEKHRRNISCEKHGFKIHCGHGLNILNSPFSEKP